jgi:hypothetical protein
MKKAPQMWGLFLCQLSDGLSEGLLESAAGHEFRCGRIGHDAAMAQDDDTVADGFYLLHDVGGQHHG